MHNCRRVFVLREHCTDREVHTHLCYTMYVCVFVRARGFCGLMYYDGIVGIDQTQHTRPDDELISAVLFLLLLYPS